MALSYSMDKIGPMARAASDCSLILSAISGHDARDKGSLPDGRAEFRRSRGDFPRLRLGTVRKPFGDFKLLPEVQKAFDGAVEILRSGGHQTSEVDMPEGPYETAAGTVISVEGATAFRDLIESGRVSEINDPLGKVGAYVSTVIPGDDFLRAMQIRGVFQKKADAMFEDIDLLVAPSLPVGASTLETNLESGLSFSDANRSSIGTSLPHGLLSRHPAHVLQTAVLSAVWHR
jgi:aspartyl-tRNA(Asn)/glutamyl-tRNA(Gln) amidotransferase subunit A